MLVSDLHMIGHTQNVCVRIFKVISVQTQIIHI